MGFTPFDLKVDAKITMSCRELVQKIMESNGIQIFLEMCVERLYILICKRF